MGKPHFPTLIPYICLQNTYIQPGLPWPFEKMLSTQHVCNWLEYPKYLGKATSNVAFWLKYWTFCPEFPRVFGKFELNLQTFCLEFPKFSENSFERWLNLLNTKYFWRIAQLFWLILPNILSFQNNPSKMQ